METLAHIRTFSGRHGRLSLTQKQAISHLLPKYQMPAGNWNFQEMFEGKSVFLEIGSGDGLSALAFAKTFPEKILLAVDVYTPGVAQLIHEAELNDLSNLKVVLGDALTVLKYQVSDKSLDGMHIFFPDPWPKKRHHKRRLLGIQNLELFKSKLKSDSEILVATDWAEYASIIQEQLGANLHTRPKWRPVSKFEKKAITQGRKVFELSLVNRSSK